MIYDVNSVLFKSFLAAGNKPALYALPSCHVYNLQLVSYTAWYFSLDLADVSNFEKWKEEGSAAERVRQRRRAAAAATAAVALPAVI
jgi:hypothetical protein